MLYVQDKIIKLGGIKIPGQIKSVEVNSSATIDDIQDDKGNTKKTQPTGYDATKVSVEIILEDTKDKSTLEQIQDIQRLFKTSGQKKAKLLKIVNEDCAARGVNTVYFKSLTTKKIIAESKRIASLELIAPMIAKITTKKKSSASKGTTSTKQAKSTSSSSKKKTVKQATKSPSKDTRVTSTVVNGARHMMR